MSDHATPHNHRSEATPLWSRSVRGLLRRLVAISIQGLVGLLPLIVTVVVIGWLSRTAERVLGPAIQFVIPASWYISGMGVFVGVIFVFTFGLLINVYGVPRLIDIAEQKIGRVPMVKTIYGAVRDLLSFFTRSGREGGVSQVVVVTFGDSGIKAVGLLMRDTLEGLPEGLGGDDYLVVYFPQSYQLGGMLLVVPRKNVTPLDMNLEDALRFIITAGAKGGATAGAPRDASSRDTSKALPGATPIQDRADLPPGTSTRSQPRKEI
ncbi:MAG: DUF502 domain-containing protein [Phycisphaeraceae bacterium]|nr:DUF502 domain-containing protein [Phycisphaeraceae bacterium]